MQALDGLAERPCIGFFLKRSNRRNSPYASLDAMRGVLHIHAANCDHRNPDGAANFSQIRDALWLSKRFLRRRLEDWSEEDVTRSIPFRCACLLETVAGDTNGKFIGRISSAAPRNHFTCRHGLPPQMHASRAAGKRDIKPVVHQYSSLPLCRHRIPNNCQQRAARQILLANLDPFHASSESLAYGFAHTRNGIGRI